MKKLVVMLGIVLVGLLAFYLFATRNSSVGTSSDSEITYYEDGTQVVYCDENGNRYNTVAEAKAAGLTASQYGATYCTENTSPVSTDYVGLTVAQAQAKAETNGVPFRVVMENGESLPVTMDLRPGRINATVVNGVVTEYSVETDIPLPESASINASTTDVASSADIIIGMTVAEATAHATAKNVPFRIVMQDGESLPVTMDLRPGRINAVVEAGVVVSYTIE